MDVGSIWRGRETDGGGGWGRERVEWMRMRAGSTVEKIKPQAPVKRRRLGIIFLCVAIPILESPHG